MQKRMNCFERFDAVLNHQKPDKMPFYFPSISCSVASEILGRNVNSGGESLHFKEELCLLDGKAAHDEFVQRYMEDAILLNRKLNADIVRQTWRSSQKPSGKLDDCTLLFGPEDGPHIVKRYYPTTQSYGIIEDTTGPRSVDELSAILKSQIDKSNDETEDILFEVYRDQLKFKKLADPYFPTVAMGLTMGIPMHSPIWLEATALETELLADFFLRGAEDAVKHIHWLKRQGFRFINGGADIASSAGPIYSPAAFERIMVPALKRIADECARCGMVYCYRSDGNLWKISGHLFSIAAVQAYGEVDRDAGMTVGSLRDQFPDLIILGNNSSKTLHQGTEEEVRRETRASLTESGGSHFIPGPSNAIMHGTPAANVYAMIDEIDKYDPFHG